MQKSMRLKYEPSSEPLHISESGVVCIDDNALARVGDEHALFLYEMCSNLETFWQ